MPHILTVHRQFLIAGLGLADLLFFGLSSPQQVPSFLLIVGFLLLVASIYYVCKAAVWLVRLQFPGTEGREQRLVWPLTAAAAFLLAMQSAGQLTLRDLAAFVPLVVLGYGYYSYLRRTKARS